MEGLSGATQDGVFWTIIYCWVVFNIVHYVAWPWFKKVCAVCQGETGPFFIHECPFYPTRRKA